MTTISSTSRISGLVSGMDTDTMVSDMMAAQRIPMDKLERQKQILEWQQEDYRTLNTALYEFRNNVFDMRLEGTFNKKAATLSNESITAVNAGSSAVEGSYTITVNNLASGVSKASTVALADEKDIDGNTLNLFNQFTSFGNQGLASTDNIMVNINGTALEFNLDQDNIYTVVDKINNADLGVKASYDNILDRFFLTTTVTGSDSQITITEDSSNFFSSGSNDSILNLNIDDSVTYNGQNASIDFGDATGLESTTNSITVNGLTFNLISEGSSTITVSSDTDAVVDSVKNFVEAYNKVLNTLNSKVMELPYRDYLPLTEAQKAEMTDDQIGKWEAKASSGLLRNDALLQNIISQIRGSVSGIVSGLNGQYNSFSSIGITGESYDAKGKLHLDENKLREALAKDGESVKLIFTNSSDEQDRKGIAVKLYELTANGIRYISDKAGGSSSLSSVDNSYIGKRLSDMDKSIEKWEKKLQDIENRYYSQFTALETLISKMNSQSSWLSAQFSNN